MSVAFTPTTEWVGRPSAAYAVGRRNGGAVVRNRLRRRLREAMRAAAPDLVPGAYLLRATAAATTLGFGQLCESVRRAALAAVGSCAPRPPQEAPQPRSPAQDGTAS